METYITNLRLGGTRLDSSMVSGLERVKSYMTFIGVRSTATAEQ